jgi:hypothetical protein
MFRPNCRAIIRLVFEEMEFTIDQPEDGPKIGPKFVAGIII